MVGTLQPLGSNFKIVNPDGTPTDYFIQWAQQRQIDLGTAISQAVLDAAFAGKDIIAGDGLDGGGSLANDVTLTADVQEILDQISTTRGTVLYRGASAWAGLAPGTSGHFLKTNGSGADPSWAAASGGGSAWTTLKTWDFAVDGATGTVDSGSLSGYNDVMVIVDAVTTSVSTWRCFRCSVDSGATYDNAANYRSIDTTGVINATDTEGYLHTTSSAAARYSSMMMYGIAQTSKPKTYYGPRSSDDIAQYINTSAVTNIRVFPLAGASTFTGGKIWILAR